NSPYARLYLQYSSNRSTPMRPYDERLDHFLSRAAKVFADQGYHSTTMRDLAAATDMSLAGMYYYVRGKEELLFRIQERCFMRVLAGAEGARSEERRVGKECRGRRSRYCRNGRASI